MLRDLGDLPGARDALERAQIIFTARLGGDHPDVTQTRASLATVLQELKESPTPGQPPDPLSLFDARVGAGNPLATVIPKDPGALPAPPGQPPELHANDF